MSKHTPQMQAAEAMARNIERAERIREAAPEMLDLLRLLVFVRKCAMPGNSRCDCVVCHGETLIAKIEGE